jgi:phosphonate transport system permease protein
MSSAQDPKNPIDRPRFSKESFWDLSAITARFISIGAVIALVSWSIAGMHFDFSHFVVGFQRQWGVLSHVFPQSKLDLIYDRKALIDLGPDFLTTVQMGVSGTFIGAICAIPISFFAARTIYFPRVLSGVIKTVLNILRAIPTIVYALIVIALIGLGPAAGASAIAFVTFISLAKLFAEGLESVSPGPIEAVRAAGGNGAQVFVFGMLPQVFPLYLSTMLYSFEYNIKDSFIVGLVGAGGLGNSLMNAINISKWQDAGVILFMLIILVNIVDYISYITRRAIS